MSKVEKVPAEAVFNEENKEWELGAKNAEGKPIGAWKFWLKDGHLVCDCEYDDLSRLKWAARFHPDGTHSQKVNYLDGVPDGVAHYQRSTSPTEEKPIPDQAPANVFRMEYVWKSGEIESSRFWDVNGDEIDSDGDIINPIRRGDVPEGATFDPRQGVWKLEELDEDGDAHGLSRWWRPTGRLIEEHRYEHGQPVYQRRIHPNGEPAFERRYSEKTHVAVSNTRWATDEETDIDFPRGGGLDPSIVKTHYVYDEHGYIAEWIGWDKSGKEITREVVNRSFDASTVQAVYSSMEEASAEWNAKGAAFYAALNAFILEHNIGETQTADEGKEEDGEEEGADEQVEEEEDEPEQPSDERGHMERFVLQSIEKLNKAGLPGKARELFHPSFEPFSEAIWKQHGRHVHKVCSIEGKLVVNVDDDVYCVVGDTIQHQSGLVRFGMSKNKRFFAKCYADRIDVVDGFDGRSLHVLSYPKNWGDKVMADIPNLDVKAFKSVKALGIVDVLVGNEGGFVVLVTRRGVFFIQPNRTRLLLPPAASLREVVAATEGGPEAFDLEVAAPRAELSNDDKMVVMSGEFGQGDATRMTVDFGDGHVDGVYNQTDSFDGPLAPSRFHTNGKYYLLGLVKKTRGFFGMGGSIDTWVFTMDMDYVRAQKSSLFDDYEGSYSERTAEMTAVGELGERFLIGMTDCYLWVQGIDENTQEYVFVGASGRYAEITSIDVSPDGREIFVGTNYGAVWRLALTDRRGEGFITNMNLRDERRYLFLKTFEPMIW